MKPEWMPSGWIVSKHGDTGEIVIRDGNEDIIANLECDFPNESHNNRSNNKAELKERIQLAACLMAEAPELYRCLYEAFQVLCDRNRFSGSPLYDRINTALNKANGTIRAATE